MFRCCKLISFHTNFIFDLNFTPKRKKCEQNRERKNHHRCIKIAVQFELGYRQFHINFVAHSQNVYTELTKDLEAKDLKARIFFYVEL